MEKSLLNVIFIEYYKNNWKGFMKLMEVDYPFIDIQRTMSSRYNTDGADSWLDDYQIRT